ncbi:MAG: TetR/AcrR family transcriptional regulator C-terminal domain-containing protein [Oscillospiraceae bacterium]|nr:TetR/AcrR family transcriptional regulator C-terminal domain-containing protein [Oscillospiraceae bacterium]
MSHTTKALILDTFSEQLERMPFEKITVSGIIKTCGISRNTFYYHFDDIYDLVDQWMDQELGKFTDYADDDWPSSIKAFLYACRDHKKMVYHLFDSLSRDRLERYVFTATDNAIHEYVSRRAAGLKLPPQRLAAISNICRYAIIGYFLRFLWNGMHDDVEEAVNELSEVFSLIVNESLAGFAEPQ